MLKARKPIRILFGNRDCCRQGILCVFMMVFLAACDADKESSPTGSQNKPPTIESFSPIFGPPSASVTIRGENFSEVPDDNSVTVNGVEAQVTSANAVKLEIVIPPGALSGQVTVSTSAGADTSEADFIVMNPAITWRYSLTNSQFRSIAWSGAELVAVGNAIGGYAIVARSTDGLLWSVDSLRAIDTMGAFVDVIWDGTRFITISDFSYVFTSPDGNLWTLQSQSPGGRGLFFDGSGYFVYGFTGIHNSDDLIEWSTTNVPFSVWAMTKSANVYVAVGKGKWRSPDGLIWTKVDSTDYVYTDVMWSGSRFIAVYREGSIAVSHDGIDWSGAGPFSGLYSAIAASGYYFVSGQCNAQFVISNDGTAWESSNLCINNADMVDLVWTGSRFVFVSDGGSVYTIDWP